MPITQNHFSVGTVAVRVVAPDTMAQHVCIHNHEHSSNSNVYIGGQNVTVNNGIHAAATTTSQLTIGPGDSLWAIADTPDCELHILTVRQD
jgi:LysM repeat protein